MIKGILFDFDGTLSNRVESAYFMYRWMVHEMLPEMDVHDIEFERIVQRCMLWDEYGTINKTHVLEMLKKHYVPDLDVETWKDKWYATFLTHGLLMVQHLFLGMICSVVMMYKKQCRIYPMH